MAPRPDSDITLTLESIVAGYGPMTILHGASFGIERGKITTVIGPNGAGKSTVFKAIFGLIKVREGRIMFEGEDVTNRPPRRLIERGISYVPQGRNVFPELSVRHNLELGGMAAPKHIDLEARVEAALDRFPILRTKARDQASTLSGGQQKLLEIARSTLLEPKLLLIDEPSIGLSPIMTRQTFDILLALRESGVTVLLIEQNARSALQIADYGLVLEQGRARLMAPARDLLGDPRIAELFLGGTTHGRGGQTPDVGATDAR